jgi:hypothetical protein
LTFDWCNQMRLLLAEVQSRSTTLIGSHLWLYRLPVPSPSNWTSLFWNSPRTSPKFGKFFFFTAIQLNQSNTQYFILQFGLYVVQHRTTER